MINLLKNKHTVVGISVRGKKFNLNRELCLLLEAEERELLKKIKNAKDELMNLKKVLNDSVISSEGERIKSNISFEESGNIQLHDLTFINALSHLDQEQQFLLKEIIQDFLNGVNKAIEDRNKIASNLTKKIAA